MTLSVFPADVRHSNRDPLGVSTCLHRFRPGPVRILFVIRVVVVCGRSVFVFVKYGMVLECKLALIGNLDLMLHFLSKLSTGNVCVL